MTALDLDTHLNTALDLDSHLNKLRTLTDLAQHMGVSRNYIIAMKRHGFVMPGRKASLAMARHFLTHCADFKIRGGSSSTSRPKIKAHCTTQPPPMDASCDTAHEPAPTHGPRKPSSGIRKIQLRKASSPR